MDLIREREQDWIVQQTEQINGQREWYESLFLPL